MKLIQDSNTTVVLAPMEGVTDAPMRELMGSIGSFTFCISEFFRISQNVPGKSALKNFIPELNNGSKTISGTPVLIQFLGGNAGRIAQAALTASELGAKGIDLNFGCPAPTVNSHDGGATLLKYPERIFEIVKAVRESVPREISVSAKLRLGWDNIHDIYKNAEMVQKAGADWITIHGRTKVQGYKPPAYWEPIGIVRKNSDIPVVANGEIWTLDDFKRCRDVTECRHYMIGRSALYDPALAEKIQCSLNERPIPETVYSLDSKEPWARLFLKFAALCLEKSGKPGYAHRRLKNWISLVGYKEKREWLSQLQQTQSLTDFFKLLDNEMEIRMLLESKLQHHSTS